MNRKQRDSNRHNASVLALEVRKRRLAQHTCENCGQPGGHWMQIRGVSIDGILSGVDDSVGYWLYPEVPR